EHHIAFARFRAALLNGATEPFAPRRHEGDHAELPGAALACASAAIARLWNGNGGKETVREARRVRDMLHDRRYGIYAARVELFACHAEAAAQGPEPLREALVKLIHFVSRRDVELGLFFLRQAVTDDEERATIEIFRSMLRRRAETPLVEGAVDGVLRGYLEDTAAMDRLLEA